MTFEFLYSDFILSVKVTKFLKFSIFKSRFIFVESEFLDIEINLTCLDIFEINVWRL